MNGRNRNSCRQIFKNRIQKFIILTLDLVLPYILQTSSDKCRARTIEYMYGGEMCGTVAPSSAESESSFFNGT